MLHWLANFLLNSLLKENPNTAFPWRKNEKL